MRYQNCIFDLYGTLVDIHTDETSPRLWARMAEYYRRRGALYHPGELRSAYFRLVHQLEGGPSLRQEAHEAHPEIQIERVFQTASATPQPQVAVGQIQHNSIPRL